MDSPVITRVTRLRVAREHDVEDGVASAEVVLGWMVILMMLAVLVVGFARYRASQIELMGIARDAARAAAQHPNPAAGQAAAQQVLRGDSAGQHVNCHGTPQASVSGTWAPGSAVTVVVTCTVDRSDLMPIVPGTTELRQSATAPIETYLQGPDTP